MTVQDLIDELSKLDKSLEVGTNKDGYFYESMFVEIRTINDDASLTYEEDKENELDEDLERRKAESKDDSLENDFKRVIVIVCD